MKKSILLFLILVIFITSKTFSHEQNVHQYMVREAYKLLSISLSGNYPVLQSHVGTTETGDNVFIPGGKLVIGAYREDEEDAVYWHFFPFGWTASNTHFWRPDGGDNWQFVVLGKTYENAYQKAIKYIYGGYELDVPYAGSNIIEAYTAPQNLFEFYKTKRIYYKGYYQIYPGDFINRNYWITSSDEFRDKIVWEILGRVCHLIADMSVPAHVHGDRHPADLGDPDSYEVWMGNGSYTYWNYLSALNQGGIVDVSNKSNPLKYLLYTTAQITDFFPSNDYDGNNIYGCNDPFSNYSGLQSFIDELNTNFGGAPPNPFNEDLKPSISDYSFNYGIRMIASFLYWFAKEANLEFVPFNPKFEVTPTTNNIGSGKADASFSGSFIITNIGDVTLNLTIQAPMGVDLVGQNPAHTVYKTLYPGNSTAINYSGYFGGHEYGPFTETITIDDNDDNIHKTHTITGTLLLPDYCYGETDAKAASPEEQLFDKAFIDYFAVNNKSLDNDKSKSIKERLSFAYKLLKQPETESVDKICKMIIDLYPESEMGISFYAMGLLWEASLSKEAPEFGEKEFKSYLKELTERKDKYKINGYAQLISSLLDVGNDIKGLERLFTDYKYDVLKELALFHQFIHYYVYKQDKERAREISDKLDKMFVDSKYGYQAHLIFGDEGYSLEGMKKLMDEKKADLLAKSLAKSRDNQAEILSEMPTEYKLFNNYPNPFNPTTIIKYSVPKVSNVRLSIYNMMGQLIKTLVNETKAPGFYNAEWNGTNESNLQVSSGIYFYRFESDNFISNKKMILLR